MGAGKVAQKLVPQAMALGGSLDQAGNVGDDKAAVLIGPYYAQIGMQGGERIIGHLGAGGGHGADEGGFAGVGHAQQADVRQHFEFQVQVAALPFLAVGELAGCAVGAGFEMEVAEAATAALGHHHSQSSLKLMSIESVMPSSHL